MWTEEPRRAAWSAEMVSFRRERDVAQGQSAVRRDASRGAVGKANAWLTWVAIAALGLSSSMALGAPGDLLRTFLSPNPNLDDRFGWSIAAFGSSVLIGSLRDQSAAPGGGAAYLFDASTGAMVRSFVSPTPTAGGSFGCSVAFLGDEILVGAHRDTVDVWQEGAAYLFDGSSGELIRTFQNPTPVAGENFGYSVAVMGGNVLIGATGNRTGSVGAGAAYLFDGSTGTLLRTFTNPDPVYMGSFGNECAAVGDGILIGAYRNDHEAGAAYLFDISTGALLHEFRSAPGTYGQGHVGTSLGALGNGALVGAPSDATYARGGDVLLFDTATGALLRVFENPRTGGMDNFGYSVSSVGDNLLVGAPYDDTNWYNSGAAYLLDGQTGALIHEFPNPTPADRDCFGQRVATLGNNVLISAIGDSQVGAVSGAVYLFEGIPEPAALLLLALGSLALARRRR